MSRSLQSEKSTRQRVRESRGASPSNVVRRRPARTDLGIGQRLGELPAFTDHDPRNRILSELEHLRIDGDRRAELSVREQGECLLRERAYALL